jgi:hypothetical protein
VVRQQPAYDGYKNYGQFRKAQNQERKYERDLVKQQRFNRDQSRADRRQERNGYGYPSYSYPQQYQAPAYNYREYRQTYPDYQPPVNYGYAYPNYQPPVNYGYAYPDYQTSYPWYGYANPFYSAPVDQYYSFGYSEYYDQSYDPYYSNDLYDGGDWKEVLLRTVISAFLSNGSDEYFGGLYSPYAYSPYNYAAYEEYPYYTQAYGPVVVPQYSAYDYSPYYGGYAYDPYSNVLSPAGYGGDQGELTQIADYVDLYTGGLGSELLARALGTGYYQGLLEGRYARRNGYAEDTYYDPYAYYGYQDQTISYASYEPYSTSLGDCRRMFSEGYELGYQDALENRRSFYDQADEGDVDLVSLLIGSALSLRG